MRTMLKGKVALALFVSGVFAVSPVFADKPEWAGNGKPGKQAKESKSRNDGRRDEGRDGRGKSYFNAVGTGMVVDAIADLGNM